MGMASRFLLLPLTKALLTHDLVMYGEAVVQAGNCRCPCTVQEGDLELLCKRHATSKLQTYEDLTGIGTLGFRGEALASISCMAHLSVITRHAGSPAGLKASYRCAKGIIMCDDSCPSGQVRAHTSPCSA